MRFLSDEWLTALAAAARARVTPADDPLAEVAIVVEQAVIDGPSWRMAIDGGRVEIIRSWNDDSDAHIRLTSDRETATAIASGRRAALDAFIMGDLVIGGDVRPMLAHAAALETLGDLFAGLRDETDFGAPDD